MIRGEKREQRQYRTDDQCQFEILAIDYEWSDLAHYCLIIVNTINSAVFEWQYSSENNY